MTTEFSGHKTYPCICSQCEYCFYICFFPVGKSYTVSPRTANLTLPNDRVGARGSLLTATPSDLVSASFPTLAWSNYRGRNEHQNIIRAARTRRRDSEIGVLFHLAYFEIRSSSAVRPHSVRTGLAFTKNEKSHGDAPCRSSGRSKRRGVHSTWAFPVIRSPIRR